MLLVRLSLALALTSLATAAAIPSSPALQQFSTSQDGESLSSRDASWTPATQSATLNDNHNRLSKRTAYYFPETVPDEDEVADRITALREAGLIASEHGQHPKSESEPKSIEIETPDAGIDAPRARTSPVRDWMAELDRLEATESVWEMMPSLLPPLRFFVLASSIIAVLTVIRGCLRARR
jgi:hypothetical protein